jgi:hypothetical protein
MLLSIGLSPGMRVAASNAGISSLMDCIHVSAETTFDKTLLVLHAIRYLLRKLRLKPEIHKTSKNREV